MRVIEPVTDEQVERRSSISQHRNLLSLYINGEWCPLVFNIVDGVECGHIKYHRVAIELHPGVNYTFPVGTCRYEKDKYILTHQDEIKLKPLPEFFGDGLYESHEVKNVFVNIGDNALGFKEKKTLRVGKDYVISKKILQGVE